MRKFPSYNFGKFTIVGKQHPVPKMWEKLHPRLFGKSVIITEKIKIQRATKCLDVKF